MSNKRILYVIGSLEVGGAERHLTRVATLLKDRGWQPEIFTLAMKGPLLETMRQAGIPVHGTTLPAWLAFLFRNERIQARLLLLITSLKLLAVLWTRRPSVVHFFLPAAYIVGGLVSLLSPVPIKIMSRRSMNHYQRSYPRLTRLEHWLHPRMTRICGNSRSVVDQLASEGVRPEQLRLIYNGIDMEQFTDLPASQTTREKLGIMQGSLLMVIVANLISYKGHADLITALGLIKDRLPSSWDLICLGRDDGIGAGLKDMATQAGIAQHIHFVGSTPHVPHYLHAADLGLLCSHEEGFSNAVLECMAAGLPMVVTDVGGNAEAVSDGDTGYVVPPRSPSALAEAILLLANHPEREQMGIKAKNRVQKLFSIDACINDYERLYTDIS